MHPICYLLLLVPLTAFSARPNIVWIVPDDMSAHFSCYGETTIKTPHVDALAKSGVRFTKAFVTSPVCSPCRTALITGMYQTTIGGHQHRSGMGTYKNHLDPQIRLVPDLLKEAGYHTSITSWPMREDKLGKTDYNFEWDRSIYDSEDWADRAKDQPFFAQIHTHGGKMRGDHPKSWDRFEKRTLETLGSTTPTTAVQLPPYYPAHPTILRDWAAYLDTVRMTDHQVGQIMARLKSEGVLKNTIVVFMTDHGISHARGKQFLYDEGLHVPLIITGPGLEAGAVRTDLVEHIDLAALTIAKAGLEVPSWMQARDILAADYQPREAAYAARDRCDETIDRIRSVRTARYKYIRNFYPQRAYLQPCAYKDFKHIMIALRDWHQKGELTGPQLLQFRDTRPAEELYDLKSDPHELHNLASDPAHQKPLQTHRKLLTTWIKTTRDRAQEKEPLASYNSSMHRYLTHAQKRFTKAYATTLEKNIQEARAWHYPEAKP